MPRYFFDVHDDQDIPDDTGTDLPDRNAVRAVAVRYAGEILKDEGGKLVGNEWSMTIRDDAGRIVLTLRFSAMEHDDG